MSTPNDDLREDTLPKEPLIMSIHQLLTTFRNDLEAAIEADSKKWLPNQEANAYLAENILEHVDYVLEWDPTGETAEDWHSPCEWSPEDES